jgi:hypothetical protein
VQLRPIGIEKRVSQASPNPDEFVEERVAIAWTTCGLNEDQFSGHGSLLNATERPYKAVEDDRGARPGKRASDAKPDSAG